MLSAVLNGGILSTERLSALLDLRADAVQMIGGVLWGTVNLPVSGSPNGRPLRWYRDALTATLLTKVLENGPLLHPEGNVRAGRAVLWSRLEATLNTLELPPWRGELNELLRAVRVSTALSAPGFVKAYLAEDLESHSLPDPVFQRVLGARLPAADSPSAEPKHAPPLAPAAELDVDFDPDLPRNSHVTLAENHASGNLRERHRAKDGEFRYLFPSASALKRMRARRVGVDLLGFVHDPGFVE